MTRAYILVGVCPPSVEGLLIYEMHRPCTECMRCSLVIGQASLLSMEALNKLCAHLQRMDQDPLKQRLEDVLPLDRAEKLLQVPADIPASIESICNALDEQDGIEGVILGRQVSCL